MKELTKQFFEKAEEAIVAAQQLLADDHVEFSAGRAYYAMFYVAEALLNERPTISEARRRSRRFWGTLFQTRRA